jgi:hypothetical protein
VIGCSEDAFSASSRSLRDFCRTPRPCIHFSSNIAGDVAFVKNSATSEGADRKASNESLVEGFSDEKKIQSTPIPSRGHANMVEARCHQLVRSSWFGGLLRRRARTSCHTEFDCDRNACANSHPVFNCPAAHHSAAVRRVVSPKNASPLADSTWRARTNAKGISESINALSDRPSRSCGTNALSRPRIAPACQGSRHGDHFTFVASRIGKKGPSVVERAILLKGKTFLCKEELSDPSGC